MIRRYDVEKGYMTSADNGEFVFHSDYDALKQSHEKLRNIAILSQSIIGGHMKYHADRDSILCKKCKANIDDADKRIEQALAETKEIEK